MLFAVLLGWSGSAGLAQTPAADAPGEQVLTRGPVHEAFAGIASYNPEPGIAVAKAPPELIDEVPPDERPEGDNVTWIPGYWAWDDERNDFLWISGVWRSLPPGRAWIAGYWNQTEQGHQWISGYWSDADATEASYLPKPPATLEEGPNVQAPSPDYAWTPGCWIWIEGRYAWRPGYWVEGRADWDWIPAHYVWTPLGFVFVEGYWDYSVERRGILFAPVYFESVVYTRRGFRHSPTVVINLSVFDDHLFLRPRYCHYYFGDYYGASYQQGGFYASFSFQSGRYGYDPFYSHQRWVHRHDRDWERRTAASFQYRREHENARPPRTWAAAQLNVNSRTENNVNVAVTINQLSQRRDHPVRLQAVAQEERQQLAQRGREVQQSRDQRRTLESRAGRTPTQTQGATAEPAKAQLTRSPIMAKPISKLTGDQAPPKVQQAPKAELKRQSGETRETQNSPDRSSPRPRRTEPTRTSPPEKAKPVPQEKPAPTERNQPTKEKDSPRKTPEESEQRRKEVQPKARQETAQPPQLEPSKKAEDTQQRERDSAKKIQQDKEQRAKESQQKTLEQSRRNAEEEHEQKARRDSERRAQQAEDTRKNEAAKKAQEAQRNAHELELRKQQEAAQRAAAVKAQEEAQQRKARDVTEKPSREQARPVKKETNTTEKEKPKPSNKSQKKDEEKKSPPPEDARTP